MARNHASQTFEPNYLTADIALKILNEITLLLETSNGKEHKTNINNVKPCTTLELVENAGNSFLNSMKLTIQVMNITSDHMINSNTYMNSITSTSLPDHIKYLYQPLELEQCYHAHIRSTPTLYNHSISSPSGGAANPLNEDIIYLNSLTDIAEANHD